MIDPGKVDFDEASGTLSYRAGVSAAENFDVGLARELGQVRREGRWSGHAVREVRVCFGSEEAARHNADMLAYLGLASWHAGGQVVSSARFVPRSDFGIDEAT